MNRAARRPAVPPAITAGVIDLEQLVETCGQQRTDGERERRERGGAHSSTRGEARQSVKPGDEGMISGRTRQGAIELELVDRAVAHILTHVDRPVLAGA